MLNVHYTLYLLLLPIFLCDLYIYCVFLALVETSYALLLTTCQPKAVGEVCHTTNYQSHSQQLVVLQLYSV